MRIASMFFILSMLTTVSVSACASPRDSMPDAIDIYPDTRVAALAEAACEGDTKKVEQLLADGVNINARGVDNTTPLFFAQVCRNLEGVTMLLENGADPNTRADNGYTPVLGAVQLEDPRLLKVVIEYGGDVDALNKKITMKLLCLVLLPMECTKISGKIIITYSIKGLTITTHTRQLIVTFYNMLQALMLVLVRRNVFTKWVLKGT